MKMMILAATALSVTGTALAYQAVGTDVDASMTPTEATVSSTMTVDPNVALAPPHSWTAEQRALYDQHLVSFPAQWTADQRAAFEAMMAVPPASWSLEQRTLYEQHMASLPTTWTPEQRTLYEQQIASLRTPWLGSTQTAAIDTAATPTAQPDLSTFAGMGGPYEEVYGAGSGISLTPRAADRNYPPCSPGPGDDHCIQLYERGVREYLASWDRPTGGLLEGGSSATAMGGPYEPASETVTTSPSVSNPVDTSSQSPHAMHPADQTQPTQTQPDPIGTTPDDTIDPVQ